MLIRFLILFLISMLVGCSNQYEQIPPKFITSGNINFAGIDGNKKSIKFLYSVPHNYDINRSFPLIIALHGDGSNAEAFHDLWKSVTDTLGFVLLVPQGENNIESGIGWSWGNNADRSVLMCVDLIQEKVNINRKRIYLTGFSSGGRLTYYLSLRHSNLFNGIAALSASFDEKFLPKNNILINKFKAYISHGSLEEGLSRDAKLAVQKLKDLGIAVKYVQYKGIGHSLPDPKNKELKRILHYLDSD